ncbi:MAG: hypothetical protein KDC34_02440 [Saprospiraceae bacterium]|nr:hypothetical protein [Saprospiraceae bacterium]
MTVDIPADLIKLIQDNFAELEKSKELPLLSQELFFGQAIPTATNILPDAGQKLAPYKNFQQLQPAQITVLRFKIAENQHDEVTDNWCEKLLRYNEIRYSSLKKRAFENNRSSEEVIKTYTQIISLFIEYYFSKGDLRFINIALKLMDLSWIKPSFGSTKFCASEVLYKRNLFLIDRVLNQLENE